MMAPENEKRLNKIYLFFWHQRTGDIEAEKLKKLKNMASMRLMTGAVDEAISIFEFEKFESRVLEN